MKTDNFDHIIKEKLESLVDPDMSKFAWEDFSKRLDSELGPAYEETINDRLDAEVQSKMKQYSVSFQSSHWQILKDQLERQAENLRALYVSKTFEVIIFALLLVTFAHNIKIYPSQPEDFLLAKAIPTEEIQQPSVSENNTSNNKEYVSTSEETNVGIENTIKENTQNNLKDISPLASEFLITSEATNRTFTQSLQADLTKNTTEIVLHAIPLNVNHLKSKTLITEDTNIKSSSIAATYLANVDLQVKNKKQYISKLPSLNLVTPLDKLKAIDAELVKSNDLVSEDISSILIAPKPIRNRTFISIYASGDQNLVNTPFDQVYKLESKILDSPGVSVGANLDYLMMDKFELGVGLAYSSVNYQPQLVEERYGSLEEGIYDTSLNNIYFNIVALPVNFKFHIAQADNWSFYSFLGASVNAIVSSQFTVNTSSPTGSRFPSPTFIGSKLETKDFTEGIFQGGSIQENIFYAYTFGIGYQREIAKDINLFSSLSYQQHALDTGVGPNEDRLNKLSLGLGIKYRL
jgi:hypothetical protein